MNIDDTYMPYNQAMRVRKICEIVVGCEATQQEIVNIAQAVIEMLKELGLDGDGEIKTNLVGDILIFNIEVYLAREKHLPFNFN